MFWVQQVLVKVTQPICFVSLCHSFVGNVRQLLWMTSIEIVLGLWISFNFPILHKVFEIQSYSYCSDVMMCNIMSAWALTPSPPLPPSSKPQPISFSFLQALKISSLKQTKARVIPVFCTCLAITLILISKQPINKS